MGKCITKVNLPHRKTVHVLFAVIYFCKKWERFCIYLSNIVMQLTPFMYIYISVTAAVMLHKWIINWKYQETIYMIKHSNRIEINTYENMPDMEEINLCQGLTLTFLHISVNYRDNYLVCKHVCLLFNLKESISENNWTTRWELFLCKIYTARTNVNTCAIKMSLSLTFHIFIFSQNHWTNLTQILGEQVIYKK